MTKLRGFAALSPELRRERASKGGRSVPSDKRTFKTNPNLAVEAGRKGGSAIRKTTKTAD